MTASYDPNAIRARFVGLETDVPILAGNPVPYINFDNAASTPSLLSVQEGVNRLLIYYASVHRGMGFKSQLSTWAYETARSRTMAFVGADPISHICLFSKNTTEAINLLARRLDLDQRDVVLTTEMEHHSNDLPFRATTEVIHVCPLQNGQLDESDFDHKLAAYADRVKLVAVSGASNVTGFTNPIHRLAEKAHVVGAMILVDYAQMAAHRPISMHSLDNPTHLDFVALSAHKMYAPFGTGALIGRRDVFEGGEPWLRGGGTVDMVTTNDVIWASLPDRDEAGSPNVLGAVALAIAIQELEAIGLQSIVEHETELTAYTLERMMAIPHMRIYGDTDPKHASERLGVIPFQLDGLSHNLVAAVLGYEYGIGVRSGCFCAHPYMFRLLRFDENQVAETYTKMLTGDKRDMPGMVRVSFGMYNTFEEVDRFIEALEHIARGEFRGHYIQHMTSGEYHPEGWAHDFASYFDLY